MTHLGHERFHVAGMCIGGPYCFGLIEQAPARIASATLFQTIGREDNRAEFYAMFDDWAEPLMSEMGDVPAEAWASFRENMYGGDKLFFNTDEAFVASIETPLLVLMGNDVYHPASSSRAVAAAAPNATFIEEWKDGAARDAAMSACAEFLAQHTP